MFRRGVPVPIGAEVTPSISMKSIRKDVSHESDWGRYSISIHRRRPQTPITCRASGHHGGPRPDRTACRQRRRQASRARSPPRSHERSFGSKGPSISGSAPGQLSTTTITLPWTAPSFAACGNGNWKMPSRDRRPKNAGSAPKVTKLPARDSGAPT